MLGEESFIRHIRSFSLNGRRTVRDKIRIEDFETERFINEFWTSKQRQSSSIHEISYRACFKAELPNFFISRLTTKGDMVYDPFSGRGTTVIEAGLLGRNIISNDVNPLSEILTLPRFFIPKISDIKDRLNDISLEESAKADIELSMFYHPKTEAELVSLRNYLINKKDSGTEDDIDRWIRMVATNRLTGHSKGFFSVYSLPPNQAVTPDRQLKINEKLNQKTEYKDIKKIIVKKSKSLVRKLTLDQKMMLRKVGEKGLFITEDSRNTESIPSEDVSLIVTSPPFLNVVDYPTDNWLRCWFNYLKVDEITKKISILSNLEDWGKLIGDSFKEFYRIIKDDGWVAFEVGEVKNGKIRLDEHVVPLGINAGFECKGIVINKQKFTKTANIWGVNNNSRGTNTNRIVLFKK